MTDRERFEAWASKPPREMNTEQCHAHPVWPLQYQVFRVQVAWEAWQEATRQAKEVTP